MESTEPKAELTMKKIRFILITTLIFTILFTGKFFYFVGRCGELLTNLGNNLRHKNAPNSQNLPSN